ncbi:MAG: hypothetical protein QOH32_357 [Bradyrhizobium sp.]|jgi:hypothetical protein|nr:hypothetical protein [Bradyrhizobium sp.]
MATTSVGSSGTNVPNPFPVYPVSSLRDIAADILERTVFTEAVAAVDTAVQEYVRRASTGMRAGLAIPVRGDYGTGKTHLLLFAQARLRKAWPGGAPEVTVLSAPATEAPFPVWYLTVLAPLLDRLGIPVLFTKVLARAACEVADQVPLTTELAAAIRKDPLEIYPVLRDGLLSQTDVERALLRSVAAIAPRGSEDLCAVLTALAWPARQDAALRWLAGRALDPPERELLGVTRDLNADAEAATVLVAIAGAAISGGGVFALMVDEFEHLMAEDQRTRTYRNATAFKRLLEGMAGIGALVLVAGHWRAWDQLPDFKARFANQSSIDVVTLTGQETGKLALQYAPGWGARLDEAALEAAAEAGGRNIRRVLAILHQLYANTIGSSGPIPAKAVELAAETRRRLAAETGQPDRVIEEVVRAAGGQVTRNETLFGRLRFDLVARRGGELRLVADVRHAATSAELTRLLDDFSIAVGALRMRHPSTRGLLVATGAVDPAALALLDAVPGVETLSGEGPGWEAALRSAATMAFEASSAPLVPETESAMALEDSAREQLRETRVQHETAAAVTRSRLEGIDFGSDLRGAATATLARESAPVVPGSAFGPESAVLDSFSESMRMQAPTLLTFLLTPNYLPILALFLLCFGFLMVFFAAPKTALAVLPDIAFSSPGSEQRFLALIFLAVFVVALASAFLLIQRYHGERRAFVRYQRWGRQKLEEMLVAGASGDELLRVKNRFIDAPDATGGFRAAFAYANELLPPWLRDELKVGEPRQ